jgi:hypothetical protein
VVQVYVPREGSVAAMLILHGSGVVGKPAHCNQVHVYYEGNMYDYTNVVTWADRVRCAAERMQTHYPTVAHAVLPGGVLIPVGEFEDDVIRLDDDVDQDVLERWLGFKPAERPGELRCTS